MSRFAELAGSRIHYDEAGQGDAVLLLHGLALDLRMWDDQVPALSQKYRVVRLDLHGFGKSSGVTGAFSHAEIISQLLAQLGIERAHVVGLSLGGLLAAELVQQYPERARSLTLVDSDMSGLPWKTLGPTLSKVFAAGKTDIEAAKKLWLEHAFFDEARKQPAVMARLQQMVTDYSGWHFANAGAGIEQKPQPRTADVLTNFALPTLVVVGDCDVADFQDMAEEIAQRIPGARKVVLNGVGHMSSMEDPTSFNRVLLEFLATIR
ncbi:MAG TPA: alpha/beta fold hydrolase [Polyangiaceae bacterium]|nr:alpha/beta fold hydrolase [Polyangiaceae bacterium]